jgi:ankyrin repeat protein
MAQEKRRINKQSLHSKPRLASDILPSEIPNLKAEQQHDLQLSFLSAASSGEFKMIKRLLKLGAGINVPCSLGWTALHYAASKEHAKTCAFLLANGANAAAKSIKGTAPLQLALENNSALTIRAIEVGVIMPLVGPEHSKKFVAAFSECISGGG